MTIITLVAAAASLLLTFAVLWANPHRASNRTFALVLLIVGVWLTCVFAAMQFGPPLRGKSHSLQFWLRANAAVVSFLPWSLWLLTTAVTEGKRALRWRDRSAPFILLVGVLCMGLSFTDRFVYEDPSGVLRRGIPYYVYNLLEMFVYTSSLARILRQLRTAAGIHLVELQFLALNSGAMAFLLATLNLLGNALQLRTLNRASVLVVFTSSVITAWALLFHRVFNAREVLLRVAKWALIVVSTAGSIYAIWQMFDLFLSASASVWFSALLAAPIALGLERSSRAWFGLAMERRLAELRRSIIEQARSARGVPELVAAFSHLLKIDFKAKSATLLFEEPGQQTPDPLNLRNNAPCFRLLCDLGWATPESLAGR